MFDKAKQAGIVSSLEEMNYLTDEEWKKVLSGYNGSSEYGDKTFEYFSNMRDYVK